jgi:hypothetical protein
VAGTRDILIRMKSTARKTGTPRARRPVEPVRAATRRPEFGGGTWLHRRMMEVTGGQGLAFDATARTPSPSRTEFPED